MYPTKHPLRIKSHTFPTIRFARIQFDRGHLRPFFQPMRSNLILRFPNTLVSTLAFAAVTASALLAQQGAAPAQPTPAPQQPVPAKPVPAREEKAKVPDYPDPRTLTIGAFYWLTVPTNGPDVLGGKTATAYGNVFGTGKDKPGPGVEASLPITRTGELKFEAFELKGVGNQTLTKDTAPFANQFTKADYLATSHTILGGRLYLDDLLKPYKFPVAKFRLKSLWAVRYLVAKNTIDAPKNTNETTATGNRQVVLPEFGLAAEYALAPHVLFRAEGSGFGIPHGSYVWDGAAMVSVRRKKLEIVGGFKALGFKTTPNKDYFVRDMISGGFVGLRYHWN